MQFDAMDDPISRDPGSSKASSTLRRLHADIVAGRLKPSQKLSFRTLTQDYGVGLSPLREALFQLTGYGLVTLHSQRGFRVAPVSETDLNDLISQRKLLEVHAFGLSIDHSNEQWQHSVLEACKRFSQVAARVGDQRPINSAWEDIHRNFHFALIGNCGSPTLLQFCAQVYDRVDRYRRLCVPAQSIMANVARDHDEITQAAVKGYRVEALNLLSRHLDEISEILLAAAPQLLGPNPRDKTA